MKYNLNRPVLWQLALTSATAVLLICSSVTEAVPEDATDAAIKAENDKWAEAWNRSDVKAVAELYSDDAMLLPEGKDPVVGRAAILEFLQKERTSSEPNTIRFDHLEVYGRGESSAEYGIFEFRDKGGTVKARGKQILIFVKRNGEWKLHRDIWTNSAPVK